MCRQEEIINWTKMEYPLWPVSTSNVWYNGTYFFNRNAKIIPQQFYYTKFNVTLLSAITNNSYYRTETTCFHRVPKKSTLHITSRYCPHFQHFNRLMQRKWLQIRFALDKPDRYQGTFSKIRQSSASRTLQSFHKSRKKRRRMNHWNDRGLKNIPTK